MDGSGGVGGPSSRNPLTVRLLRGRRRDAGGGLGLRLPPRSAAGGAEGGGGRQRAVEEGAGGGLGLRHGCNFVLLWGPKWDPNVKIWDPKCLFGTPMLEAP